MQTQELKTTFRVRNVTGTSRNGPQVIKVVRKVEKTVE